MRSPKAMPNSYDDDGPVYEPEDDGNDDGLVGDDFDGDFVGDHIFLGDYIYLPGDQY